MSVNEQIYFHQLALCQFLRFPMQEESQHLGMQNVEGGREWGLLQGMWKTSCHGFEKFVSVASHVSMQDWDSYRAQWVFKRKGHQTHHYYDWPKYFNLLITLYAGRVYNLQSSLYTFNSSVQKQGYGWLDRTILTLWFIRLDLLLRVVHSREYGLWSNSTFIHSATNLNEEWFISSAKCVLLIAVVENTCAHAVQTHHGLSSWGKPRHCLQAHVW